MALVKPSADTPTLDALVRSRTWTIDQPAFASCRITSFTQSSLQEGIGYPELDLLGIAIT